MVFKRNDQRRTEQRTGNGANAANERQQCKLDAHLGQGEQGGRVDVAQIHGEQTAAHGGQKCADGHAAQLDRQDIDARRTGRVFVFAHRQQVVAQARAAQPHTHPHHQSDKGKHQQRVLPTLAKNHVGKTGFEGNHQSAGPAGEGVKVVGQHKGHFVEGQGGNRKKGPAQPKGGPRDEHGHQGRHGGNRQHGDPGRKTKADHALRRHVSANGEKHPMAQRELAAKAANDVPRRGQAAHQIGEGQDVEPMRIVHQQDDGQGRQDHAEQISDQHLVGAGHHPLARGCCWFVCINVVHGNPPLLRPLARASRLV